MQLVNNAEFTFDHVRLMFCDILKRRYDNTFSNQHRQRLLRFFADKNQLTRLYLIGTTEQLTREWEQIRMDEALVHFMMGATNELRSRLSTTAIPFTRLAEILAEALGQYTLVDAEDAVEKAVAMDGDLYNRLPDTPASKILLLANPWFVSLLLIEQIDVFRVLGIQPPVGDDAPKAAQE